MKRAIITANYGSFHNERGQATEKITIDDLLYYSLYWDQIVIPCNNSFYNELPQENDFVNSGIVIRPVAQSNWMMGGDFQSIATQELINTYKYFKKTQTDSDFTIHHNIINTFDGFSGAPLIKQSAIRVGLANCLPYPTNINIYDLLEFKEKRKDELASLHKYLTELYLDIVNTQHSQDLKQLQVLNDFEKSINDLKQSMNEKFPNKLFFKNLISELKFDIAEVGSVATADIALSTFPNLTVVSGITVTAKRVITTILKEQNSDTHLNYIKSSIKDGIIPR